MTRPSERGGALVELALGSLVLITVLMAGVHFGEIGYLSIKVHEATASSIWDSTSYRVETLGPLGVDATAWYDSSRLSVPLSNTKGAARYTDWDGRTSVNKGAGPKQLYTEAQPMVTQCENLGVTPLSFQTQTTTVTPAFGEPGIVSCGSTGTITTINIPTGFHQAQDNGYFKAAHLRTTPMTVCGFGRANGGQCGGKLNILLGDHGLTAANGEDAECNALDDDYTVMGNSCANRAFYRLTHENWDRSMGWTGMPEDFADDVTGRHPKQRVTGFYLSFHGEESNFSQVDDKTGRTWQATPMDFNPNLPGSYRTAYTGNVARSAGDGMDFLFLGRYRCD